MAVFQRAGREELLPRSRDPIQGWPCSETALVPCTRTAQVDVLKPGNNETRGKDRDNESHCPNHCASKSSKG